MNAQCRACVCYLGEDLLTGSDDPNNDGETAAQRKGSTRSEATNRSLFCAFLTVCRGYRVFECFIGHFIATIYYRQTQLTEDWLRFLYFFFAHPSTRNTVLRSGTSFIELVSFTVHVFRMSTHRHEPTPAALGVVAAGRKGEPPKRKPFL